PVGRIMFQLFSDICPKTCKNFLCLCSGEKGIGKTTGKKLCYKGTTFHRVVKNFMIQGGDFSEGNGKGGESIYGGYFKDENFILKHDRAFLLSMANRGKHTNGSQFFITTKPAPHLDGVHVVFGLVISGFEVIEQIENLKTDTASRPYADVRVIDCGVLVTRSARDALEKKKKVCSDSEGSESSSSASSSSESSSESEAENERSRKRKRKRRAKTKQSRKRRKEERRKEDPRCKRSSNQRRLSDRSDVTARADVSTKRDKPVVRPEEIPPVPENRFLLRRDVPVVNVEPEPKLLDATPVLTDQKPSVSKSGRKIKGRGTIRYHTPPRSHSCSESEDDESSETPPHWKEEMQRLRTYRPPSGEKWSKGDKLSDPCTSRWDERSASRRSRSWSHNGYADLSSARYSSHHKKHRKEKKKVKHKKKSKKQKHFKKHKQTKKKKASASSDVESSHSFHRRAKSSCDRERKSRSSSLSSRRSSRRDWSKSDKEDQSSSSLSSRGSRSYYRSRSRSRSRSKSRSYSRRSSRSRSASKSSRSRSRSRSSSNPRQQKTVPSSPRNISTRLNDTKLTKAAEPVRAVLLPSDKVVVPPVVPESLPVIPLSDSPPPSRWKPGQKPWKPSYERIQEMKAKTTHLIPTQANYGLVVVKEANTSSSSYRKRERSSESDRSGYSKGRSDRSSESWPRSRSRSSRSRSYSRSYTRSRSPSSSRTKSHSSGRSPSPSKYRSDRSGSSESTSCYSLSDEDRHGNKRKSASSDRKARGPKARQETSSESPLPRKRPKDCDESSQGLKESDTLSSSDFSSDSERSAKAKAAQEKESRFPFEGDAQKQDKNSLSSERGEEKSKGERGSDRSKRRAGTEKSLEQPRGGAKTKRKSYSGSKWDSESNSERGEARHNRGDSRPSSGKEEGEATSGSDTELSVTKRIKKQSNSSEGFLGSDWKTNKQLSSSESDSSCSSSADTRGKPKKHKHGLKKQLKKSHSKKPKEKSKGKKEKKHKVQKRKEMFHWQPPLEFGEEEDDEINEKPVTKEDKKEKQLTRDVKDKKQVYEKDEIVTDKMGNGEKSCVSENLLDKNTAGEASPDGSNLNKESIETNASTGALNSGINASACKNEIKQAEESNQNGLEDVIQTDDNMEICTPDRNSPGKVDVDVLCPVILAPKPQALSAAIKKELQVETPEQDAVKLGNNIRDLINIKEEKETGRQENNSASGAKDCGLKSEMSENTQSNMIDNKWKPLQGVGNLQPAAISTATTEVKSVAVAPEPKPAGLRIEIKAKNKVRPGSLFDEVRKTARLNRRPRNQESSSEEESPSRDDNSPSRSLSRSRSKSGSKSRHRTRSISYSHSRSRSRSSTYSYRSRSYSRSRSRGWYSRDRSRSRSSSYHSYKSRSYSRSRSRSSSYGHHSRSSRSYTYDSYYSRSRSRSKRSDSYRRSRSYDRRSR
ncbi:NKTR protein, partial [Neopipo cinnamomea]|nr:NKTR protein [Neopipo cinnamomea]